MASFQECVPLDILKIIIGLCFIDERVIHREDSINLMFKSEYTEKNIAEGRAGTWQIASFRRNYNRRMILARKERECFSLPLYWKSIRSVCREWKEIADQELKKILTDEIIAFGIANNASEESIKLMFELRPPNIVSSKRYLIWCSCFGNESTYRILEKFMDSREGLNIICLYAALVFENSTLLEIVYKWNNSLKLINGITLCTVMRTATMRNHINQFWILLEEYENLSFGHLSSFHPYLYCMILHGRTEDILRFVNRYPNRSPTMNDDLQGALEVALSMQRKKIFKALYSIYKGKNLLVKAVERSNCLDIVPLILENEDPSCGNQEALLMASKRGNKNAVELLLKDPRVQVTPNSLRRAGSKEVFELLLSRFTGGQLYIPSKKGFRWREVSIP